MNLTEDKKQPLRSLEINKKRHMLISYYKGATQESKNRFDKPQQIQEYLDQHCKPEFITSTKLLNCIESLRIALTNNPVSWICEFGAEGLRSVFNILKLSTCKNGDPDIEKLQSEILKCILKFANNTDGLKIFFKEDEGHELVARCINYKVPSVSLQALKVSS